MQSGEDFMNTGTAGLAQGFVFTDKGISGLSVFTLISIACAQMVCSRLPLC